MVERLDTGTANVPTKEQIEIAQKLANQNGSFWDFGNPPPPSELISGFNLDTLAPFFHNLWTALGFNPPPLNPPAPGQETDDPGGPVNELRASEKVVTADASALDDTELDNGEPERGPRRVGQPSDEGRVSTQAQQDVQSITPTVTEPPADRGRGAKPRIREQAGRVASAV